MLAVIYVGPASILAQALSFSLENTFLPVYAGVSAISSFTSQYPSHREDGRGALTLFYSPLSMCKSEPSLVSEYCTIA